VPAAAPLPNWEENENDEFTAKQATASHFEENLSDDDDDLFDDKNDDPNEPDPFESFLNRNNNQENNQNNNNNIINNNNSNGNELKRKKPMKRGRNEKTKLNPVFCEQSITEVEACQDPNEVSRIQTLTQTICGWKG
jgi:hypothetical protein